MNTTIIIGKILNSYDWIKSADLYDGTGTLRDFQRKLADIIKDFNNDQLEYLKKGQVKRDKALWIISDKSKGYKLARSKQELIAGYMSYVETLKTEARYARNYSKFMHLTIDQELQYLLDFSKEEEIKDNLFL